MSKQLEYTPKMLSQGINSLIAVLEEHPSWSDIRSGDSNGGYLEGDSAAGAPELDHVEAAEAQVMVEARVEAEVKTKDVAGVAEADLATSNGPGPDVVQLEVACDDPETAAARIAGFLAAEPRVLLRPAPDLQAHQDTLVLRFYLVPAVAAEQQSRIKAAIQGLAAEPALSSAAAGEPADMDNDVPAA